MKFEVRDVVILDQQILGLVIGFIRDTHNSLRNRMVIRWEGGNVIEYCYNTEVGKWYLKRCMEVASAEDIFESILEKYKGAWKRLADL